jgi:HAE1 family hydrophobic/amphiphilic exporter-1
MGLTKLAINRPLTMVMIILALIILGINGFGALKVDRFPEINFPFVATIVIYPGASPTDIETEIVKPIEDSVAGVSGLDYMQSTSREGVGVVLSAFKTHVDGDQAAIDVERAISGVQLPDDAQTPTVWKADLGAMPVMNLVLNGPQSLEEKYRLAEDVVKPRLLSQEGVAGVTVAGGLEQEIQIQADPTRMAGYKVSLTQLMGVLMQENVDVPAGSVTTGAERTTIRSLGRFSSLEDIGNAIVSFGANRVYLKDVADVVDTHKTIEEKLRLDGEDTVSLSITKQSDANTVRTAENIREALQSAQAFLPEGMSLEVVNDDSEYTQAAVDAVIFDLILAVLITGAVLLIFLHMWRSTLIVLLAVPTSLISTFLVMYAFGFSLNQVSMMALALVIGVLVDDSVVVLENIFRHLGLGEPPREAALKGRAEIGMAAIVITLADVVIYLPVAFMSGIIGQFFKEYGITIATAVLFSLFISFTLTPLLASRWLKGEYKPVGLWGRFVNAWERGYGGLTNVYGYILHWSLHHRPVIVAIAFVSLVGAFAMVPLGLLPTEFMPAEDTSKVTIDIQMPAGTDLETTDKVARQVEEIALTYPETKNVLTQVGSKGGSVFSQLGSSGATLTVNLVDKKERKLSSSQVADSLRGAVSTIPEASILVAVPSSMEGGGGSDLEIMIAGPDLSVLTDLANQVETVMNNTPGVAGVRNMEAQRSPELQLQLDRNRMKDFGVSASDVGMALRTAVSGSTVLRANLSWT